MTDAVEGCDYSKAHLKCKERYCDRRMRGVYVMGLRVWDVSKMLRGTAAATPRGKKKLPKKETMTRSRKYN